MPARFRFTVIGKYQSSESREPEITANVLAGSNQHFVHAGTLTMSESEWAALIDALLRAIPDAVEIEDARHLIIDPEVPVIPDADDHASQSA